MKVLIIASQAESLINFRGALLRALVHAGHDVHAAAPRLDAASPVAQALQAESVTPREIPLKRAGLNPISDLRLLWSLWTMARQEGFDVVLSYTIKPVIWGSIAARAASVPHRFVLITGLGYAFTGKARGKRGFAQLAAQVLYWAALRCANLIFFQNPDDRSDFRRLGLLPKRGRVVVVSGSGVDLAEFRQTPFPPEPLRFLLIARLLGDKGIREYAAAAARIRTHRPDVEFHLVGGGDPNPDGIKDAEVGEWQGAGDVVWQGQIDDVRPAIAGCHVYVLPSYREGTPRSVLEAMSMGRPIITTDAPGCRETVEPGVNGFLVPVRDVEALVGAMLRFVADPSLVSSMGAESRRIAVEKYDVHKINAVMLDAMNLSKQPAPPPEMTAN